MNNDKLIIGGHEFNSRFILGSGKYSMKKEYAEKNRRIRVRFEYADDEFLYVRSSDDRTEYLKVRYHVEGLNNEFNDNIPLFWRGLTILPFSEDISGRVCTWRSANINRQRRCCRKC